MSPPGALTSLLDRVRGRLSFAGWGFADQAMSSLSNFGVGLVAVRSSSAAEFGAFSVAFATAVLGVGVARALVSDVYSVRFSGGGAHAIAVAPLDTSMTGGADPEAEWIEADEAAREDGGAADTNQTGGVDVGAAGRNYPQASGAWGAALVLALVVSVICLVAAFIASGFLHDSLLLLAVGMPFLVLQDVVRYICIARRDAFGATLSDGTWVLAFVVGLGVFRLVTGDTPGANAALGLWIVGSACGVVVGGLRMGAGPGIIRGIAFARLVWRQSLRYVVDWLAVGASPQVGLYVLGATAGLAVLGETRTAFLLSGPLNIVVMGAVMILVPELTRHRRRTGSRLFVPAAAVSGFLVAVSLAWVALLALVPVPWLEKVFGDGASDARAYLVPLAINLTVVMLSQGPSVCLRATGDVRRGTRASVPAAPFMLLGAAVGAAVIGDAPGAIVGTALGFAVAGVLSLVQLVVATRSAPIVFDLGAAGAPMTEEIREKE